MIYLYMEACLKKYENGFSVSQSFQILGIRFQK